MKEVGEASNEGTSTAPTTDAVNDTTVASSSTADFPIHTVEISDHDTTPEISPRKSNQSTSDTGTPAKNERNGTTHQDSRQVADDNHSYYEDSVAGDYPLHESSATVPSPPSIHPEISSTSNKLAEMTPMDLEICHRLDQEYEWALEERDVAYHARYQSVRESACFAVVFMAVFLAAGVLFFVGQTEDWDVGDALLFSVYAITTVGYGNLHNPDTPEFQLFTVFFILVGIATLTIMVAQVYQCIALETSRAQSDREYTASRSRINSSHSPHHHQTPVMANHHRQNNHSMSSSSQLPALSPQITRQSVEQLGDMLNVPTHTMDRLFAYFERLQRFLKEDEIGRGLSVLFPFVGLISVGAMVVGPMEGWTLVEALYFSVVSLTTVGLGDYYPTQTVSIWFCILWLPFSIGFMSLYLSNVAAFYIRLSDQNILRIEKHLRRRIARAKRVVELEQNAARRRALRGQPGGDDNHDEIEGDHHSLPHPDSLKAAGRSIGNNRNTQPATDEQPQESSPSPKPNHSKRQRGFENLPSAEQSPERMSGPRVLFGMRGSAKNRREHILQATMSDDDESHASNDDLKAGPAAVSMTSMRDVLHAVHANLDQGEDDAATTASGELMADDNKGFRLTKSEYFSIRSTDRLRDTRLDREGARVLRKPSFALRALVQERFAEIIATEVAGYQDSIDIQDHTLSVTIDSLRETADRWKVPRRARKAFRAVTFEVLFFVGEFGLVTRGAEALYDLPPLVFHGLFAPLLAALGDAAMMEAWLQRTQVLADVDLRNRQSTDPLAVPRQRRNILDHNRPTAGLKPKSRARTFAAGPATVNMRS